MNSQDCRAVFNNPDISPANRAQYANNQYIKRTRDPGAGNAVDHLGSGTWFVYRLGSSPSRGIWTLWMECGKITRPRANPMETPASKSSPSPDKSTPLSGTTDVGLLMLKRAGLPLTRENYLGMVYPEGPPKEWSEELEQQLPEEIRKK